MEQGAHKGEGGWSKEHTGPGTERGSRVPVELTDEFIGKSAPYDSGMTKLLT